MTDSACRIRSMSTAATSACRAARTRGLSTITRHGGAAHPPHPPPVSQLRDRGAAPLLERARPRSPSWSTRSPNICIDVGPGHVRPDRDRLGRHHGQVRNARFASPQEVGGDGHRVRGWLGVLPFRYKRQEYVNALQWCDRPRAVPARAGPLAHLPHHRPPERRAVHRLPAPDPAADGPRASGTTCWPSCPRRPAPMSTLARSSASTRSARSRHHPRRPRPRPRHRPRARPSGAGRGRRRRRSTRTTPTASACSEPAAAALKNGGW